jgi:co-chaperonin GroES (HSP10)
VKPDVKSNISDSGLILPEDRDHVPVSGQVVALGPGGSLVKFKARQRAITACMEAIHGCGYGESQAFHDVEALLTTSDPDHDVKVGDFVAFPADVGFKVTHDGEEYVLVNEDDIAVLETA